MFEKMLDYPNITVQLNTCFQKDMMQNAQKIIWTGKIDEFFDYQLGRLPYRSLRFEFKYHPQEYIQLCEQINFPDRDIPWTRTVEIKHVTGQLHLGTTISMEYPMSEGDPYYPVPVQKNHDLYQQYERLANQAENVIFLGRLAKYKYMNMDEVVLAALNVFSESQ